MNDMAAQMAEENIRENQTSAALDSITMIRSMMEHATEVLKGGRINTAKDQAARDRSRMPRRQSKCSALRKIDGGGIASRHRLRWSA